jgi:predicted nucleotidyltransferase
VAQGNDGEDSDLDLLVDPLPDTSLLDVAMIQVELETLLGVPVDVVTPNGLAAGFRDQVLDEARAL